MFIYEKEDALRIKFSGSTEDDVVISKNGIVYGDAEEEEPNQGEQENPSGGDVQEEIPETPVEEEEPEVKGEEEDGPHTDLPNAD